MSTHRQPGHELFEELAAGHALHALEPEDEQLFLLHAAGCARCERVLDAHRETAAELAYGAGPADLPDALFGRIRAGVVARSGEEAFAVPAAPVAAAPVPASPAPVSLDAVRARRRLPRPVALLAAAAAAVLVTGLAGSNLALRQDRVVQTASSDRLQQAVDALASGPGRSVPLLDEQRRVAAVAVIHDDRVSLVVEGLQANAADTTYVLWERSRFGGVRALGTFDVRDGGVEVVRDLPLQHTTVDVAAFAITQEKGDSAPERSLVAPLASGAVEDA